MPHTMRAAGLALVALFVSASAEAGSIRLVTIDGSINPASADYLIQAIDSADEAGVDAVLIEMDTPGGLVSSMKDILDSMLNAKVPVIVYVSPRGAWAGSAGVFITMAGHVAAMSPGTTIGAAHPVMGGGPSPGVPREKEEGEDDDDSGAPAIRDFNMEKIENMLAAYAESIAKQRGRNVEWAEKAVRDSVAIDEEEALEIGVIDLVAKNRDDLLAQIEGRSVEVDGEPVTLALAGASVDSVEMTYTQRFFDFLADPNIATLLMLGGLLGLYIEFQSPGLILPGTLGVIALVLFGISVQILPFDWVGLLLVGLGIALLVAEVFVTSFGILFAAGIACFLAGGAMLFDRPDLSDLNVSFWSVLVPAVAAVAVFGGIIVFALSRSLFVAQTAGVDELVGLVARATSTLAPEGKVFVRGEYWNAEVDSGGEIAEGDAVEIVAVDGLRVRVRKSQTQGTG